MINVLNPNVTLNVTLSDGTVVGVKVIKRNPINYNTKREYRAKPRMFNAPDALVADLIAQEPRYVAYTDENSTDEDRAAEQAWRAWRKATLRATTKRANELVGILSNGTDAVAKFSYKAGCSCGCSPAYIVNGVDIGSSADIWLS
jgi:hypothetical protein